MLLLLVLVLLCLLAHSPSLHYCWWSLRYCTQFGRGKKLRSQDLVRRDCETESWLRADHPVRKRGSMYEVMSVRGLVKKDKVALQHGGGAARSRERRDSGEL